MTFPSGVFNSACPWASSAVDLAQLYASPFTSAVTTRTTTLTGFPEDPARNQAIFFGDDAESSQNSYGYSPFPLSQYLDWLRPLTRTGLPKKQLVVSIAGTLEECAEMCDLLVAFSKEIGEPVAVEYNASCPNIPDHPPPAYIAHELADYLALLTRYSGKLITGIKLPPYTYDTQFDVVVNALLSLAPTAAGKCPITFLTATNTLGQGIVYADQTVAARVTPAVTGREIGLPVFWGGLAGKSIHQISLGNVKKLRTLLSKHDKLKGIKIIGVGGVCDPASAQRMRAAGADAVACATALGREGVEVFGKISQYNAKL